MPFKPIKSKYEIDEVDEEVLWEELRKVPEDLSLKVDTLLHELFHAIWSIGQLKEKDQEEERAVAVMASYMTQILRDNPHLVKWITKNLPRNG